MASLVIKAALCVSAACGLRSLQNSSLSHWVPTRRDFNTGSQLCDPTLDRYPESLALVQVDIAVKRRARKAGGIMVQPPTLPFGKESTASEITGVTLNAVGDGIAFLTALATNIAMVLGFLLFFILVRKWYPLIYSYNARKDTPNECPKLEAEDTKFGWFQSTWSQRISEITEHAGLDQAMLIQFTNLSTNLLLTLAVPLNLIVGPCHWLFGGNGSGEDHLSKWGLANVVDGHKWIYWMHSILVWLVVVVIQRFLFSYQSDFMRRRKKFLMEMPAPRATTILVENIPEESRTDKGLSRFFEGIFGKGSVKSAFVVKRTGHLCDLIERRAEATRAIKEATFQMEKSNERPTFLSATGQRNDTIEHYTKLAKDLAAAIKGERARIDKEAADTEKQLEEARQNQSGEDYYEEHGLALRGILQLTSGIDTELPKWQLIHRAINSSAGFVTFANRQDSQMALCCHLTANEEEYVMSTPPDPADVLYNDLQGDGNRAATSRFVGYCLIGCLFVGFMPFVLGVAQATRLQDLASRSSAFQFVVDNYPGVAAVWDAMMGSLALEFFMSFLPTFLLKIFSQFFVLKAEAFGQSMLQTWYFCFLVIFVLLVTAVGTSLKNTLSQLIQNPLTIFALLASNMPVASHFYLNYIALQWTQHFKSLCRTATLVKFLGFKMIYDQDTAREMSEPEDQDYYGIGSRSARWTLVLAICLVFSLLSPIVLLLGAVNFIACRLVYGYLIVFAETKKPDLGGVFWCTQLIHVQKCTFIFICLMVGVLFMRASTIGPCILAGLTIPYHAIQFHRFKLHFNWEYLPLVDSKVSDSGGQHKRKGTRTTYKQPELCADE
jgi:hypothetical protein